MCNEAEEYEGFDNCSHIHTSENIIQPVQSR